MIYVPNVGETEMLRSILTNMEIQLGLYKNQVVADGNTIIGTLVELPTGGSYGYAPKTLPAELVESALTAQRWYLSLNSQGKAEAQFHNAALTWVMTADDVAAANSVYGAFGYIWVLPFDAGAVEIKVGDLIKGATSGATAKVAMVSVISGTWAAGTAAGLLYLKTKSGTWQNNENIIISGKVSTITLNAGGSGYAVGNIFAVTQAGAAGSKGVVTTVDGGGAVTGLVIVEGGQGHSVANALDTTNITGAGTGLKVNITVLATTVLAVSNSEIANGGDAHKKLIFVDAFTEGHALDVVGLTVEYTPKTSLSTA